MKSSSSTPRSFSRTPSRRTNGTSSGGTPGLGQHSSVRQQFDHMMGSFSENEAQQTSGGVADFINGKKTPSRNRRTNTGGRSSSRRHHGDTPTQFRSTGKSAAESESDGRSYDKSYTHTTDENDTSSSNRNFRYGSNIRSSSKTPNSKTKTSSSAKADGRIVRSPTEIVLSPVKQAKKLFGTKKHNIGKAMKDASTQTEWEKEVVFTIRLNRDVTRSVQNRAQGDPNRRIVGTGDLKIMKCVQGSVTHFVCQLVDDGTLKFQAKIPDSSEAHKHMFLNPEVENSFVWDAYDASGGVIINRAFCFVFDDGPGMFATLLYFFGGRNVDIVREFLKGDAGRFMPTKQTLPSHSIVKNEDDMDVNSDDEEHRPAPLNKAEEEDLYGEVVDMSQALW